MNIRSDHDNNFLWNLQWLGFWGFLSESLMRIKSRESVMERHRFGSSGRDGRQAQWEATKSWIAGSALLCWVVKVVRAQINCDVHAMIYKILCKTLSFVFLCERDCCAINLHRWKLVAFIFYTAPSIDTARQRCLFWFQTESVFYQLHRRLSSWTAFGFRRSVSDCERTQEVVISTNGGKRTVSECGNFMIRPNNTRLSLEVRCTLSLRLKSKFNSPDMLKGNIFG